LDKNALYLLLSIPALFLTYGCQLILIFLSSYVTH
jgi:hypothetical protein